MLSAECIGNQLYNDNLVTHS